MTVVIPGMLVMSTFLIVATLIFTTALNMGRPQAISMLEAADEHSERLATVISIVSVTGDNPVIGLVDNDGSTIIGDVGMMDVFLQYIPSTGSEPVARRFTYAVSNPSDNQWTINSYSPDTFNPGLWDPSEQVELELRPVPAAKAASTATLVVATPNGATDSRSFVAP